MLQKNAENRKVMPNISVFKKKRRSPLMNAPLTETNPNNLRKNNLHLDIINKDPVLVVCNYCGPQIVVSSQELYLSGGRCACDCECSCCLGCTPHTVTIISNSACICRIYRPVINDELLLAYCSRADYADLLFSAMQHLKNNSG